MARLGLFTLPFIGHVGPLGCLARALMERGHQVWVFTLADFAPEVERRGMTPVVYGGRRFPPGALAAAQRRVSELQGKAAAEEGLALFKAQADALFEEAPPLIDALGLDLWIVDQLEYGASTLAAIRGAPFVTVIPTLLRNPEEGVPGFSGERPDGDAASREREARYMEWMLSASWPFREVLSQRRVAAGLAPLDYNNLWSPLAQISQQPAWFEFPRRALPPHFHFTGPFARATYRPEVPFPWERLDGRPLIYATFGTTQHRSAGLYAALLEAVAGRPEQVVVSLGGAEVEMLPAPLPDNVLAVSYAPQLALLERACLMVTHGGMNGVLECLAAGVPMGVVPIAHDQPGVAARVEWIGAGLRLPAERCAAGPLREMIAALRGGEGFTRVARECQARIAAVDGLAQAADLVEQVLSTGRPALRVEAERREGET